MMVTSQRFDCRRRTLLDKAQQALGRDRSSERYEALSVFRAMSFKKNNINKLLKLVFWIYLF